MEFHVMSRAFVACCSSGFGLNDLRSWVQHIVVFVFFAGGSRSSGCCFFSCVSLICFNWLEAISVLFSSFISV